jgi:hypothetical protein
VQGSQVSGAIPVSSVPAGSPSYIQNSASQQPGANFNISGSGTAGDTLTGGVVNATTQYNIAGMRMLTANGPFNFSTIVLTASNTFLGESGGLNTMPSPTPSNNAGKFNSFFGANAGKANTTGCCHSFFGALSGEKNTTGFQNSFFGQSAGNSNTEGWNNSFFGIHAGRANTTGIQNAFFGAFTGTNNTTGSFNTLVGRGANVGATDLTNATALGADASVAQSNSLVLGGITGINNGTSVNVGIGTTTPSDRLHVVGDIRVGTGTTGCVKDADASVIAGTCSSDARLKHSVTPFPETLDKLIMLRPVHFYWRADEYKVRAFGAAQSFGLIAQEVERVLPELVTEDEQGLKAVRYNKLPLLMLQAVKELKAEKDEEIVALKMENDKLKQQLKQQEERLRRLEAAMSKVGGEK